MTIIWLLYDFSILSKWLLTDHCTTVQVTKSDNWMPGNVNNQGDFKLTALANLLTSCMTFDDFNPANAWLWWLCMTNVKCVILLRFTSSFISSGFWSSHSCCLPRQVSLSACIGVHVDSGHSRSLSWSDQGESKECIKIVDIGFFS